MDFTHIVGEAEFWVGAAFLVFVLILWRAKVPSAIAGVLDSRGQKIRAQLDEATKLRAEAESLLADIKTQREAAETSAKAMIAAAQADAVRLREEATVKLADDIERRRALAERKIATAEAQAAADVKAAAADLATQAAEAVLAARIAGATSDPLIDQGLAQIEGRFQ
jgi:F-type H+-transporting ATPase subunit b